MSKASSFISTPISTPAGTSESKKRYLSSPFSPEDKLVKENKAYIDSMESLDKSDVSVSLLDPVYEMETVGSAHLHTLPETEIEKIANLLKSSIQGDILTAIKQDLSVIMKTAVSEVIDDRLKKLHDENKHLTQENEELKTVSQGWSRILMTRSNTAEETIYGYQSFLSLLARILTP